MSSYPLDKAECQSILSDITYKPGYQMRIVEVDGELFLQATAMVTCVKRGTTVPLSTHAHKVSIYLSKTMFIQLVFTIYKELEDHEAREHFRYRGRRIYNPHTDVHALWEVCETEG